MPTTKEYNVKIASMKSTRKMTKTMQMVSASKLRKAQEAQRQSLAFAEQTRALVSRLAASVSMTSHPLLEHRAGEGKILLLVFTSDRGLCGGFNNNLCKFVMRWIAENREKHPKVELSFCGRRGHMYFKKRGTVKTHYEGVTAIPKFKNANRVSEDIVRLFLSGEYDEVYLVFNHFKNPLSQTPVMKKILPVEPDFIQGGEALGQNYLFEPSIDELLAELLPKAVTFQVHFALLENAAGEHGARMTSMDSATSNADKLIDQYTLLRNRARQAHITGEMIEIVSGAEAL